MCKGCAGGTVDKDRGTAERGLGVAGCWVLPGPRHSRAVCGASGLEREPTPLLPVLEPLCPQRGDPP